MSMPASVNTAAAVRLRFLAMAGLVVLLAKMSGGVGVHDAILLTTMKPDDDDGKDGSDGKW